jgi:hypothetical protein
LALPGPEDETVDRELSVDVERLQREDRGNGGWCRQEAERIRSHVSDFLSSGRWS